MKMRNYYIFKSGRISRKDNTVFYTHAEGKVPIPVNDIDSIFLFGECDLNTKALNFFSQHHIMIHFFNYYGFYTGSFYPKEFLNAGDLLVRQAKYYLSSKKRIAVAKEFIQSAYHGIVLNLKNYPEKTGEILEKINLFEEKIGNAKNINALMGIEGNIRELYYQAFPLIIRDKIEFQKR